jgi:hypothetical protein
MQTSNNKSPEICENCQISGLLLFILYFHMSEACKESILDSFEQESWNLSHLVFIWAERSMEGVYIGFIHSRLTATTYTHTGDMNAPNRQPCLARNTESAVLLADSLHSPAKKLAVLLSIWFWNARACITVLWLLRWAYMQINRRASGSIHNRVRTLSSAATRAWVPKCRSETSAAEILSNEGEKFWK